MAGTLLHIDWPEFLLTSKWAHLQDFQVSSDAARCLGCNAVFQGHWFVGSWSLLRGPLSIACKELFYVCLVSHLWGPLWVSNHVEFLCDNEAVVAVLKSSMAKNLNLMGLLCYPVTVCSVLLLFIHLLRLW